MSTIYFAVCHDCREYIDLDRLPPFPAYVKGDCLIIDDEDLEARVGDKAWVYKSMRLQFFHSEHRGHRQGVYNQHEWEGWLEEDGEHHYKNVYHWPSKKEKTKMSDATEQPRVTQEQFFAEALSMMQRMVLLTEKQLTEQTPPEPKDPEKEAHKKKKLALREKRHYMLGIASSYNCHVSQNMTEGIEYAEKLYARITERLEIEE